jgi:hypothetical protein
MVRYECQVVEVGCSDRGSEIEFLDWSECRVATGEDDSFHVMD